MSDDSSLSDALSHVKYRRQPATSSGISDESYMRSESNRIASNATAGQVLGAVSDASLGTSKPKPALASAAQNKSYNSGQSPRRSSARKGTSSEYSGIN